MKKELWKALRIWFWLCLTLSGCASGTVSEKIPAEGTAAHKEATAAHKKGGGYARGFSERWRLSGVLEKSGLYQADAHNGKEGRGHNEIFALPDKADLTKKYQGMRPQKWGDAFAGITSRLDTKEPVIALTFDACGWGGGSAYDEGLIQYLVDEDIPATLFISGKWIEDNPGKLSKLAAYDIFEIENHGYLHKPLSVNGRAQFGLPGTASVAEVYDEVAKNADTIYEMTGELPRFFRTGTAFYDDVAVSVALELGEKIAGFSIAGDAGGTLNKQQIINACKNAGGGDIILFHMNRPGTEIAEGVKAVTADLKAKGFRFVLMKDYDTP